MPNKKRSQKSKKTSFKASNFTSSTTGKYFLVFGILLAVSVPMMFWQFDTNPITGFVSYKAYKQTVNLDLPESTMYILSTRNPEQLNITSFAVYGDVIGEGRVEIYLQSNEKKLLMYSNVREVDKGLAALTGMVIGDDGSTSDTDPNAEEGNMLVLKEQKEQINLPHPELTDDNEVFAGAFINEAGEASYILMQLSQENVVRLVFNVEEGTRLNVNEILYTLEEE
jgi:hypothetical protein